MVDVTRSKSKTHVLKSSSFTDFLIVGVGERERESLHMQCPQIKSMVSWLITFTCIVFSSKFLPFFSQKSTLLVLEERKRERGPFIYYYLTDVMAFITFSRIFLSKLVFFFRLTTRTTLKNIGLVVME